MNEFKEIINRKINSILGNSKMNEIDLISPKMRSVVRGSESKDNRFELKKKSALSVSVAPSKASRLSVEKLTVER